MRGSPPEDTDRTDAMTYQTIKRETAGAVAILTIDRPKALNALNGEVMRELVDARRAVDADRAIGCTVLTGSAKAFAAGADIKEMAELSYVEAYRDGLFAGWDGFVAGTKPVIAAVAGYALGGGCELAMMCDFIIAARSAKFGQPEIQLGVMPGMGGSQRLTRAVGKSKAMEMILTGRNMDADEAERCGLVARVVDDAALLDEATATAAKIAALGQPAVAMAKEAVDRAFETPLAEGVRFERRLFHSLFATHDQKEGMAAFVEKRQARFENR